MTFNNFPIIPLTFSQHTFPSWWYLVRDVEDQTSNNRHLGERQAESKRLWESQLAPWHDTSGFSIPFPHRFQVFFFFSHPHKNECGLPTGGLIDILPILISGKKAWNSDCLWDVWEIPSVGSIAAYRWQELQSWPPWWLNWKLKLLPCSPAKYDFFCSCFLSLPFPIPDCQSYESTLSENLGK